MPEKTENKIYSLAKKISTTQEEEKLNKLLIKLNTAISEHFEAETTEVIEEAINIALESQNLQITDILMDEIHLEIENIYFENEESEEFDSSMLIMPCAVVTRDKTNIPSINDFETIIRKHFMNNGIIKEEEQFFFGTVRLNQSDLDSMTLQDWWNVHRHIVDEHQDGSTEEQQGLRNKISSLDVQNSITIFYMTPIVINKNDNKEILENVLASHNNLEMWDMISQEINELNSSARLVTFPPMPIREGIDNSNFIMQGIEFDMFFDEYAYEEDIDVGYMQLEEDPEKYVVLFFDNESQTLSEYFIYETDGEPEGFISMLLEKCFQEPIRNLFSFDSKLSSKQLEAWTQASETVDISQLLQNANQIDIDESFRLFSINNPNIDGNKKQTIH